MGPLAGLRIVEFEGIGPGPLAGMLLADMGAEVTVIRRRQGVALQAALGATAGADILNRGKKLIAIDLKHPAGVALAQRLVDGADALIEGNRPGVMERLGLGPEPCLQRNPKLVYGRMTGWGQDGPLAQAAGHDLNYVALSGLLGLAARRGQLPVLPPTVMGDAAGALGLAFGIVCALLEAKTSGRGQVVDAAIVDIVSQLGALVHWLTAAGQVGGTRPSAFHDSPFYDVYACADGKAITVGALEPQFYALLLEKLGIDDLDPRRQYDIAAWPALKARLTELFKSRTRDEWCALLEGTDVCFAPMLDLAEAAAHPHNRARGNLVADQGVIQSAPAPRFSRSVPPGLTAPQPATEAILDGLGVSPAEAAALRAQGVVG